MSRPALTRFLLTFLLVAVVFVLQAPEALADGISITTDGFTCSGGAPTGSLFASSDTCPTALSMDNIFTFLVCNFEQLSANIMGRMYCGMVDNLAPAVMGAVTLATCIYSVMFMFGMIPATGQEALKFLLKCAFIVGFATNADYLIGVAYRGALAVISDGASITIGLMSSDGVTSGSDVYQQLDGFLATLFHDLTDKMSATDATNFCHNAIFAVIATMFVIFPMFAYMALLLLGRILMTFFRAVFAYIYAIVGITFVLLLAPFFVTFALFKLTSNLFERWLGYLVSFSLQVVLLFAFLAFVFSMKLADNPVVKNLTNVIMYNSEQPEMTSFRIPLAYCTLCDFKVVNMDDHSITMTDKDSDYVTKGQMVCIDHSADSPVPMGLASVTDSDGNTVKTIPIRPTFATSPDSTGQLGNLISFAGNGILSLIILALIIEHMLKLIPSMAQKLASSMGANYATQLGGGENFSSSNTLDMPGSSLIKDFNAGFNRGFESNMGKGFSGGNGLSATAHGIKDGLSGLITGRRADITDSATHKVMRGGSLYKPQTLDAENSGQGLPSDRSSYSDTGIGGAFQRALFDPTKLGQ